MNEDDPLIERADALLARTVLEGDDEHADVLAAEALVDAAYVVWGQKIDAAKMLLAEAERALNKAEATTDPVKRRANLRLFELYMRTARTGV
jgi:hypothetical protein